MQSTARRSGRQARQVTLSERQYNVFSSSSYFAPTTIGKSPSLMIVFKLTFVPAEAAPVPIIAIVVGVIIGILVVMAIVIIVVVAIVW